MRQITSKENPSVKELAKLYASARCRRESGRFVLEGVRLVVDALENSIPIRTLFVTGEGIRRLGDRFAALAAAAGETLLLADSLGARVGDTLHPQGVFAVCEGALTSEALPKDFPRGCLILSSLQDPGNVGTILRSAAAFGPTDVILSADCPDPASPKVLRAAMGVRRAFLTHDVVDTIGELRSRGTAVFAAALGTESVPVDEVTLAGAAVVIGNEGRGLAENVIAACDKSVILPIAEGCESLNAAMAAAVFAWELSRAAGRAKR